jgi:hypothetical protein
MDDEVALSPHDLEERAKRMHPILRPFALFLSYVRQTQDILRTTRESAEVSIRVIKLASGLPPRPGMKDPTPAQAEEDVARMQLFLESGIPIANGHALVGVWGAFEAWAKDIVCARVEMRDAAPLPSEVGELAQRAGAAVTLHDLLAGGSSTVSSAIVSTIEQAAKGGKGLGCVEARLAPIGLSAPVAKEVRDALYYAEKIRHLYAHRAGIADAKFLSECPTLNAPEGERYRVDSSEFDAYMTAFQTYVQAVLEPVGQLLDSALKDDDTEQAASGADASGGC